MSKLPIPTEGRAFTLANARVPRCLLAGRWPGQSELVALDIAIDGGRITSLDASGGAGIELGGRIVWPCGIDVHTHLDKGHIWQRAPNPNGTFDGALATVAADREARWTAADVRARFEFGLRCAYAHGTCAIRTHLDNIPPQGSITWPVFAELRDAWAGRITLQAVSLAMLEHYDGAAGVALADLVAEHGGILGLVPQMVGDLDAKLDHFFALAIERGLAIDCHVDETGDPTARTLAHLARAALRNGYDGPLLAGHCCSLARQEPDEADRTLDLIAEAGIAIVTLPSCNMYLQDRVAGRTPRWRGITLVHEMRARGIPVAIASDNCRDPFFAYGDHDLHEVFRAAVRIAHLDHPLADWPRTVTATPAALMGIAAGTLAVGAPADLVIFQGRTMNELLSRPESGRIVLRAGVPIDTTPPDYAELDALMG